MVGVPGKSKGCNTCRRRKVKCDETRPACLRCVGGNRTCEGYERFPVFINRSQHGLHRRQHLEEARPANRMQAPRSDPSSSLVHALDNTAVHMQAYTGYFIGSLLPSHSYRSTTWSSVESYRQAFAIAEPSAALSAITQALATTRFGRHSDNGDIYRQGRRLYGNSLKLLQQAIEDPSQCRTDDTMAAVRLMIAYESYEATTTDSTAWHSHIDGLGTIVKARGPHDHTSAMSQAILLDLRYAMMIHAMTIRKRNFMAEPIWQQAHRFSDCQGRVIQIMSFGFEIAAILEDGDKLAGSSTPDPHIIHQHLMSSLGLQERLVDFAQLLLHQQGAERRCDVCGVNPVEDLLRSSYKHLDNSVTPMTPCDFFLQLSIVYGFMVAICGPMQGVYMKFGHQASLTENQKIRIELYANDSGQKRLGREILRMAGHFLHQELGHLYNRSAILPLQVARLASMGDPVAGTECLRLIRILSGQQQIPFAMQVNRGQEHVSYFARRPFNSREVVADRATSREI